MIRIGNAPVSYGAFEVTIGVDPNVIEGVAVLDALADAGYAGVDLGPVGYLGEGVLKAIVRIGRIRIDFGTGGQVQGQRPKGGDVAH